MKRIYLALLLVLAFCSAAFALSDKDYLRLKRSSKGFARADAELSEVYEEIKDTMSAREFERVKREQRNWVRTGRDAFAKKRMRAGDSRSEAYTAATLARVQELRERYLGEEPEGPDSEPRPIIRNDQKVRIPDTNPQPRPEPELEPEPKNAALTVEDIQGIYKNHAGTVMKISYLGEVDDNEMQVNFDADDGQSHERWTSRGVFDGTKIELDTEDNGEAVLTFRTSRNGTTVNVKLDDSFLANSFFSEEVGKTVKGTYDKQ
ncbi:MAG: DUF1311 domain-containing protein [Synergistaceae bacterium]|nr:DUF1311 domain-containing protein [Synergistaceae bacterium]